MSERPQADVLDEPAIADDRSALARRLPVDVLQVPRQLGGMFADIRTIAAGMAVLPKLLLTLDGIQDKVDSLDGEMRRMRAAVERMGGDVSEVQRGIARVEPHLEDVSKVAHPLRRLGHRARRSGGS